MTVTLRPATLHDVPLLQAWDLLPHVIACTTDDPTATTAFEGTDWAEEIAAASGVSYHLIAEVDGRPIGAMQIIDPQLEPTHYWGDVEPNLRALDIWIGETDALGHGYTYSLLWVAAIAVLVGVVALFIGFSARDIARAQHAREAVDAGEL